MRRTAATVVLLALGACAPTTTPSTPTGTGTETATGDRRPEPETGTGTATGTGDRRPEPETGTGSVLGTSADDELAAAGARDDRRGGYVEIEVPGFLPAVVFVPPGPPGARFPLAVVMHGAGGRPEPHCEHWRRLLRERAVLVCPRGTPWGHVPEGEEPVGYFFREHRALGREVVAAIDATQRALGPRLDAERALFAGYSQGATMGALFLHELARDPARARTFGRVALVEGGTGEWNVALSRRVAEAGVERVLMACGQTSCARAARDSVGWMRRGGLDVRFEDAPGAGHTWGGGVGERVVAALPWLLEGDPRF